MLTEIQAPGSLRRADALWLPVTTSGRGTIIGHEIKVSRSDVITELRDPMKADSWLRFCSRWWLVVSDPAFITGLDIPAEWGVLAPPSRANTRFMTVIQHAPTLTPDLSGLAKAWGTIFAKTAFADIATVADRDRWADRAGRAENALDAALADVRRLELAAGGETTRFNRMRATKVADVMAAVERLGEYSGDGPFSGVGWQVEPDDIAKGVLAFAAAREGSSNVASSVRNAMTRAEKTAAQLRAALAEIERSEG